MQTIIDECSLLATEPRLHDHMCVQTTLKFSSCHAGCVPTVPNMCTDYAQVLTCNVAYVLTVAHVSVTMYHPLCLVIKATSCAMTCICMMLPSRRKDMGVESALLGRGIIPESLASWKSLQSFEAWNTSLKGSSTNQNDQLLPSFLQLSQ